MSICTTVESTFTLGEAVTLYWPVLTAEANVVHRFDHVCTAMRGR